MGVSGMDVRVDSEFKSLVRPLTGEEYAALEASILEEGCRDAITALAEFSSVGFARFSLRSKTSDAQQAA